MTDSCDPMIQVPDLSGPEFDELFAELAQVPDLSGPEIDEALAELGR